MRPGIWTRNVKARGVKSVRQCGCPPPSPDPPQLSGIAPLGVGGPGFCSGQVGQGGRRGKPAVSSGFSPDCWAAPWGLSTCRSLHKDCPRSGHDMNTGQSLTRAPSPEMAEGWWEEHRGGALLAAAGSLLLCAQPCAPSQEPVICPGLRAEAVGPEPGPPESQKGSFWKNLQKRLLGGRGPGQPSPGCPQQPL